MKLKRVEASGVHHGWVHWCPGCEEMHVLPREAWDPGTKKLKPWTFNGDMERPTFDPSFKHTGGSKGSAFVCHYNIVAGVLVFHSDCSHALRGNVPLPDIPSRPPS